MQLLKQKAADPGKVALSLTFERAHKMHGFSCEEILIDLCSYRQCDTNVINIHDRCCSHHLQDPLTREVDINDSPARFILTRTQTHAEIYRATGAYINVKGRYKVRSRRRFSASISWLDLVCLFVAVGNATHSLPASERY